MVVYSQPLTTIGCTTISHNIVGSYTSFMLLGRILAHFWNVSLFCFACVRHFQNISTMCACTWEHPHVHINITSFWSFPLFILHCVYRYVYVSIFVPSQTFTLLYVCAYAPAIFGHFLASFQLPLLTEICMLLYMLKSCIIVKESIQNEDLYRTMII